MSQKIRPTSDISIGNWVAVPAAPATAYDKLDETVANDADYVQSPLDPTDEEFEVKYSAATDPGLSTGYVFRYRYGKNQTGGQQIDLTVILVEGATVIATWVHTNIDAKTTAVQTLTGPQADAIVDHGNLRLRGRANAP